MRGVLEGQFSRRLQRLEDRLRPPAHEPTPYERRCREQTRRGYADALAELSATEREALEREHRRAEEIRARGGSVLDILKATPTANRVYSRMAELAAAQPAEDPDNIG